jgi:hypothetical protein
LARAAAMSAATERAESAVWSTAQTQPHADGDCQLLTSHSNSD